MSWCKSSGVEHCNRCHRLILKGESMWVGIISKATWCAEDAEEIAGAPPKSELGLRVDVSKSHPEFTAAMQALKARAALKLQRSERSFTGERE